MKIAREGSSFDGDIGFMSSLYEKEVIDHYTFSIYTNIYNQSSWFKFGSMDPQALLNPDDLTVLATVNSSIWALEANSMGMGEGLATQGIQFEPGTVMVIDPSIPYLYLPIDYWSLFQLYIEDQYHLATCNDFDGKCVF